MLLRTSQTLYILSQLSFPDPLLIPHPERQDRRIESDQRIIDCLRSPNPISCLEQLADATKDRVPAYVLAERCANTFGQRSKAQPWRDRALSDLSEVEAKRIENRGQSLLKSQEMTSPVARKARYDQINKYIDQCLHSGNVIESLESLAELTKDRVAAYVLACQYGAAGEHRLATEWRTTALSGLSAKDKHIIKWTAEKLLSPHSEPEDTAVEKVSSVNRRPESHRPSVFGPKVAALYVAVWIASAALAIVSAMRQWWGMMWLSGIVFVIMYIGLVLLRMKQTGGNPY
jgi:hypothetical protein